MQNCICWTQTDKECVHLCQSNMLQMIVIHELQVFTMVTAEAATFLELADLLGQEIRLPAILDPQSLHLLKEKGQWK